MRQRPASSTAARILGSLVGGVTKAVNDNKGAAGRTATS